jgi:hypothetical protein
VREARRCRWMTPRRLHRRPTPPQTCPPRRDGCKHPCQSWPTSYRPYKARAPRSQMPLCQRRHSPQTEEPTRLPIKRRTSAHGTYGSSWKFLHWSIGKTGLRPKWASRFRTSVMLPPPTRPRQKAQLLPATSGYLMRRLSDKLLVGSICYASGRVLSYAISAAPTARARFRAPLAAVARSA